MKQQFMSITMTDVVDSRENQVGWILSDLAPSEEVVQLDAELEKTPGNVELLVKKGLAYAKARQNREAIDCFSLALSYNPFHALAYRHRGHRHIGIRMYKQGAADLELGSRIDPTNWDIWYHLGLAYYLLGDFKRAEKVYQRCLEITDSEELLVAISDWYWMTLMRLGKKEEAAKLLEPITEDTDPGENSSYHRRLLMYKGIIKPEDLVHFEGAPHPSLELATQGYGLANYYYVTGKQDEAMALFKRIVEESDFWGAFGYLAAEVEVQKARA